MLYESMVINVNELLLRNKFDICAMSPDMMYVNTKMNPSFLGVVDESLPFFTFDDDDFENIVR